MDVFLLNESNFTHFHWLLYVIDTDGKEEKEATPHLVDTHRCGLLHRIDRH